MKKINFYPNREKLSRSARQLPFCGRLTRIANAVFDRFGASFISITLLRLAG
jgi:hypothetical protein